MVFRIALTYHYSVPQELKHLNWYTLRLSVTCNPMKNSWILFLREYKCLISPIESLSKGNWIQMKSLSFRVDKRMDHVLYCSLPCVHKSAIIKTQMGLRTGGHLASMIFECWISLSPFLFVSECRSYHEYSKINKCFPFAPAFVLVLNCLYSLYRWHSPMFLPVN